MTIKVDIPLSDSIFIGVSYTCIRAKTAKRFVLYPFMADRVVLVIDGQFGKMTNDFEQRRQ